MRFGAHVRRGSEATSGVVEECRRRGADCAQVFLSNPRAWAPPSFADDAVGRFRSGWTASGLTPLAAHAPYLVNIASPDRGFLARSRSLARSTVHAGDRLGVDVLVLHAGAGGDGPAGPARRRAARTLREAAAGAAHVRVAVELMAGTRGAVASTIPEAAALLGEAGDDRIGLCLDVCHLFAAGYALDDAQGAGELVAELAGEGLTDRVCPRARERLDFPPRRAPGPPRADRRGYVGVAGWRALLARPEATGWAFVLETPGDAVSHAAQIGALRALAPG